MPQNPVSWRWAANWACFGGLVLSVGSVCGQYVPGEVNNVFPLAPRELRQRLSRAQAALDEERYSDAVAEIGEVLNAAGSDDFFLGAPGSADAQVSLKTEALALLGSMPPKGRKIFELQYGSDAKAALESALAAGDLTLLTEVSRRYFQTKAGYEATLLLGRYQLDQGRPLAAALTLKRVADVPWALAQYDPELSVLLATCWIHANQPAEAQQTLLALKKRMPQAKVHLVDREVNLFDRDSAALPWLQNIVGGSRSALASTQTQWTVYRGDEKRNAQSSGGVPLLNVNWNVPTLNDPADEARVAQKYREIRDKDEPLICALQPLVVQDYAIVRQPESSQLIGISLKSTKRVWVYPPFDESATSQAAREAMQMSRNPTANVRELELKQRIWQDHTFGEVSSDGRHVYVIDDLGFAPLPSANQQAVFIGRGGLRFPNPGTAKPHNLLVALDLAKQGYQVWAVGGTTGDNPALSGAFFLGPPLPVGDQLYALAEFTGEIRLVCLDARTGGLDWKQPLANIEEQHVVNDPSRRLAGASPSLAEGILVCPTSAGAVVAVDLATRTLRWGYQYRRNDIVQMAGGGFRRTVQTVSANTNGNWLDSTATIAEGSVVLTPPESQQLHCLDLLSGKARWSPIARDDMLLVACIHKGNIILIGKNRLKAIKLEDGKPAWPSELKLDGEVVVGRGYYHDSHYYLPVSGQQICKIDLETGEIIARAQTEVELGNLVCYQDQLISQSPLAVASFVLLSDQLQQKLEQRLAANPRDVDALALKAQILLQAGKADESLALLRRAAELAPDRNTIRDLLVKVMLSLVRQDFAKHAPLTDELDKLVTDAAQRREVVRWRVQGLAQSDRVWDAFQSLLELADQELTAAATGAPAGPMQTIDRERNVRMDRWLQAQLKKLVERADSDTSGRMKAELKLRLDRALSIGSTNQLRMFLNLFGFHEISHAARLALIDRLLAAEAFLEAEVVAGDPLAEQNPAEAAAARAALAAIYEKAKRPELAARMYQELADRFARVPLRGGATGGDLATKAMQNAALKPYFASWATGQVDVKDDIGGATMPRSLSPLPITHYFGAAPRGLKASFDSGRSEVALRSSLGQLVAAASIRNDNSARRNGNSVYSAKANGHLLVVNLGSDVLAVDGLRADRAADALLWRQETTEDLGNSNNALQLSRAAARNPLLGLRSDGYNPPKRLGYGTGPVTKSGVCFQRGRQLVCVDPMSGQSLWERSASPQAEIPQQADIFGDEELLFIADARLDAKAEDVLVISAIDGSVVGRRKVESAERRFATHGRRVLTWEEKNNLVTLRLLDAWDNQRELWSRQVSSSSRAFLIDGEELALLEADGQFSVVSLASGQVRFAMPLAAESDPAWIHVFRSDDQYLLLVSQEKGPPESAGLTPLPVSISLQQRGMHGRTYAFSRTTGKLQWQSPAFVSHHWLPPDQPAQSPLLLFVASRQVNNKMTTAVLALDRRTGRSVYEQDLNGHANSAEVTVDIAKQSVTLSLIGQTNRSLNFLFTDKPLPPQPPAQTGEMASNSAGRPAGVEDKSLGAAIDLFRRGSNGLFGPPEAPPAQFPVPAPRP